MRGFFETEHIYISLYSNETGAGNNVEESSTHLEVESANYELL